ncbi:MaoC/PaaZ C-terminal domain-containing protein [Corynebacterium sp. H78]|uniref:MaoC/PaaZ C-terminal domain-containing protein n=1 Tax=Corynebacterium sp. H78 TaxID=3133417 RepID=UPI0030AFB682
MVKTLKAIPSLGPLYAKAAAGSAKKRPTSTDVKVPMLAVHNVAVSRSRDDKFRDLVGARTASGLGVDEAFFGHVHALLMPVQMELMAADDFPLPMMGLIHTSNTYRRLGAVELGSTVDIEVSIREFRAHRAGTEVVLVSTVRASRDDDTHEAATPENTVLPEILVEEESVYLAKGVRLKDAAGFDDVEKQRAAGGNTWRELFAPPLPTAQWKLAKDVGRRWAAVSGDWNPIHINGVAARALGMPGVIAHGMFTASKALASSDVPAGEPYEFAIDFATPVVLPASVMLSITRAGEVAEGTGAAGAGAAGAGVGVADAADARGGMDIVAWNRKKKRPHFTATVRDI